MAAFSSTAFSTSAFSTSAFDFGASPTPDQGPPLGGKGDNERGPQYPSFKPSGLLDRPVERGSVSGRIEDSRHIEAEITERLAREFTDENARLYAPPVETMSPEAIAFEIGIILRRKVRREEDELLLLLLMAASAA